MARITRSRAGIHLAAVDGIGAGIDRYEDELEFPRWTSIHASSSPRRPGCAPRISGSYARHDDLTTNFGLAYQIAFIRLTGRATGQQSFEILEDLVGYVATELNANPRDLDLYARRQPTLSAHLERVREHLGLTAFSQPALRTRIRRELLKGEQLHALARCVHYGRLGRWKQGRRCPCADTHGKEYFNKQQQ